MDQSIAFFASDYLIVTDGFLGRIAELGYSPKNFPACSERSVYRIADEARVSNVLFERMVNSIGMDDAIYLITANKKIKRSLERDVEHLCKQIRNVAKKHKVSKRKVWKKVKKHMEKE